MNADLTSQSTATAGFSISAQNISKRFNREWIFRNLNYEFQSGNTYAITGPNGSGKSTLLQVLWGQVPPSSGSLSYRSSQTVIDIGTVHEHLAIATPYMALIEEFTLREMLAFHFALRPVRPGINPGELPSLMYLEDALNKPLVNFSSGMIQRLKLALAFFTQASAYFFDEPTTNLDSRAFEWYREQLSLLPQDALVLIASNDPREYPNRATTVRITDFKG